MSSVTTPSEFGMVASFVNAQPPFDPSVTVGTLVDEFFQNAPLEAVAVVQNSRPLGLITRQKILFTVFRRFGWEVFHRRPVAVLADREALVVTDVTGIDQALGLAISREPDDAYDDVIVVDALGNYIGLLSVRQMIVQHSRILANILMQKEVADAKARELEQVSEIKARFLANVTHELRSPVNAIIELAELMRIAAEKGHVSQIRDRLTLMLSSATNLRSIITNILDLSKIEAGRMEAIHEETDLVDLLQEVAATTRILVGSRPVDVTLETEGKRTMTTDPVKLRQIVLNLTSNAAKFTDSGSIRIRQSFHVDHAIIDVIDTGIGIRAEDLERLFEAFSQLEDAKHKRHGGTGLGLAITRELLELLGGQIDVQSEIGLGATFTIRIPDMKERLPL